MLNPKEHVLESLDDYLHDLLSSEDADVVREHCEDCKMCGAGLEEAQQRMDAMKAIPPSEPSERLVSQTLEAVEMKHEKQKSTWKYVTRTAMFATAASVLIIGGLNIYYAWLLQPSPYDLRLLAQNRYLADTTASMRVGLYDHRTGESYSHVPIEITLFDPEKYNSVMLAKFTTGEGETEGQRFQLPDWKDGEYTLRIVAKKGWTRESLEHQVKLHRSWKLMLSSDKPIYQPGQNIRLRALALRRPDLKPVTGQEVVFSVTDPKGNMIFKDRDVTSRFGITAVDCQLATEIIEGPYQVECRVGDVTSERTVKVEKYVLPKFKIDVTLDKPFYGPGDRVSGSVESHYFFGKPVAGANLSIDVRAAGFSQQQIANIDEETDEEGKHEFRFALPAQLFGREQDGGNARFQLVAMVTDTAGQTQSAGASRVVTSQPIQLEVIPESGTLVQGMSNTVYVYARYADGRPAKVRLVVHGIDHEIETNTLGVATFELTPKQANIGLTVKATDDAGRIGRKHVDLSCGGVAGDFLVRTDKAVYDGGDTMDVTALGGGVEPVFLDLIKDDQTMLTKTIDCADGKGSTQIDLPPDLFGTIRLEAYRFGKAGLAVRKTRMLFVRQAKELRIKATLEGDEYQPGETAKLNLELTDEDGNPTPGAISLAAVDEAVYAVLNQSANMETVFFLLEQELLQPVYAIYSNWGPQLPERIPLVEREQFNQALFSRTAAASTGSDAIPIDLSSNSLADAFREASVVNIEPAFDEAVFSEDPSDVDDATPVNYETPHTLASRSFPIEANDVRLARRSGIAGVTFAWFGLFGAVVLFGLTVFAVTKPKAFFITSGAVAGVVFLGIPMFLLLMVTTSESARDFITQDLANAGAAPGAVMNWAAGAEGGDLEMDMAEPESAMEEPTTADAKPAPRLRQWFPETLLWKPELLTDDQGNASIEIPLADSITSWRLSMSAVSAAGQLGRQQLPIKVFQPFFVELNLPVSLTRGDEVSVPVVVYNYLDEPQAVEIEVAEGEWFTLLGDDPQPKRTINLEAGAVSSIGIPLKINDVGIHNLKVTAHAGETSDAIKRQIEIVPNGRRVEEFVSGKLDEPVQMPLDVPEDVIPGSVRAIVKLHPSTFSQLIEGLDAIFAMPSGCFEQTSSTTYPNVLALDYIRRTNKSVPSVEAKAREYIHVGYQRLISFEVDGGGFDWFGNPPANMLLSAYGLMEFEDMARVHDVDPNLIQRTRNWLLGRRQADGSWSAAQDALHDDWAGTWREGQQDNLGPTAFIAAAVFMDGKAAQQSGSTLDYLLSHRADSIKNAYVLALVINAITAIDSKHSELPAYVAQLESLRETGDDDRVWWSQPDSGHTAFYGSGASGNIETTAMAAIALMNADGSRSVVRDALNWLVEQKDSRGTWHSTQATVLALKALLLGTESPLGDQESRTIEIALGGEVIRTIEISRDQSDVMQQIDLSDMVTSAGQYQLSIVEKTESATGYQVAFRYHVEDPSSPVSDDEPLSIDIAFDRERLTVDQRVTAVATVTNNMDQPAPMVILDLPIPGGFKIERGELDELKGSGKIAKYQITPRKAIVYLRGLAPGDRLELRYRLRATMPVKVAVPPAQAYEYYNPDHRTSGKRSQLEVTEA